MLMYFPKMYFILDFCIDSGDRNLYDVSIIRELQQGCQVFITKPTQLLLKTSPMAFRGGSPKAAR